MNYHDKFQKSLDYFFLVHNIVFSKIYAISKSGLRLIRAI